MVDPITEEQTPAADGSTGEPHGRARFIWAAAPVMAVLAVFADALTNARVLFVRDASFLFWPVHRWARAALLS